MFVTYENNSIYEMTKPNSKKWGKCALMKTKSLVELVTTMMVKKYVKEMTSTKRLKQKTVTG